MKLAMKLESYSHASKWCLMVGPQMLGRDGFSAVCSYRTWGCNLPLVTVLMLGQAQFMPIDFDADGGAEMSHLVSRLGVDGFFTDCSATATAWWHAQQWRPPAPSLGSKATDRGVRVFASWPLHGVVMLVVSACLFCIAGAFASIVWWTHEKKGRYASLSAEGQPTSLRAGQEVELTGSGSNAQ